MIENRHSRVWMLCLIMVATGCHNRQMDGTFSARSSDSEIFDTEIRPFLAGYCLGCHSGEQPMAQFDLGQYTSLTSVVEDHGHWSLVIERLRAGEMPPAIARNQPTPEARQRVVEWANALFRSEAAKSAGDPGPVLARRLSNAEYNYTVRDLTGVDIRPTREFPVDPANMAGFDNSGESLSISPALLAKYLQATREVADHLVLKPTGIAFAPHRMLAESDRDRYAIDQIIHLYKRQSTDYSDYFQTAWRYKHRAQLGKPAATLSQFASEFGVSPKYLEMVWTTLETREEIGPLAKLQGMWQALPVPRGEEPNLAKEGAEEMRDFVVGLRQKIAPRVWMIEDAGLIENEEGVATDQPFLLWRNRQYATNRRSFDPQVLQVEGEPRVELPLQLMNPTAARPTPTMLPRSSDPDPDLHVPAGQRERYEEAFARFASVFPDAFYVSERGRYFPLPEPSSDQGRHLSAGFHNRMGYFRDDQPLYELILDEEEQRELDGYWRDLDFVAEAIHRTYLEWYRFYLYKNVDAREGSSIDAREIFSPEKILETKELYLQDVRPTNNELAIQVVEEHFDWLNRSIRWVEEARANAEPIHLAEMLKFAERAYRRPLSQDEKDELLSFYGYLREESGLEHEEAVRDLVVRVLMSPYFFYRIDLAEAGGG